MTNNLSQNQVINLICSTFSLIVILTIVHVVFCWCKMILIFVHLILLQNAIAFFVTSEQLGKTSDQNLDEQQPTEKVEKPKSRSGREGIVRTLSIKFVFCMTYRLKHTKTSCFMAENTNIKDSSEKPTTVKDENVPESKPKLRKVKQDELAESPLEKLKKLENGMKKYPSGFLWL